MPSRTQQASFSGTTFRQAESFLGGAPSRNVANNTHMRRADADTIELVLHSTAIVTYHRNGPVTVDHGGWCTPVTARRISQFSPYNVGVADLRELPASGIPKGEEVATA